MKAQIVADKKSLKIICISLCNGSIYDFKLFKNSQLPLSESIKVIADTGYTGICKIHNNSEIPKRRTKFKKLSKEEKRRICLSQSVESTI